MKRFIRYLYEYQQGQRVRNVGFVKVEQEEDSCVVHIHGKGLKLEGDRELKLYLFFTRDNECMGIFQGSIDNVNPAVNYRLAFGKEDTGGAENFALVDGIIMENNNSRRFAAVWNDMPVDVDHMKRWVPAQAETMHTEETQTEDVQTEAVQMEAVQTEAVREEPAKQAEPEMQESNMRAEPCEERIQVSREEPDAHVPQESMYGMSAAVQGTAAAEETEMQESCEEEEADPEEDGYITPSRPQYTKIQRQQLSRLPRCEWRLSNNSFLLHGYYNYHHLMLIDEGDVLWLGVPGVFHEREARAAEAFGFPRFIRISDEDMEWGRDEINTADDFGYWCRKVRR